MSIQEKAFAHIYNNSAVVAQYAGSDVTLQMAQWRVGVTNNAKAAKKSVKGMAVHFASYDAKDFKDAYDAQKQIAAALTGQQTLTKETAYTAKDKLSVFVYKYQPNVSQRFRSK